MCGIAGAVGLLPDVRPSISIVEDLTAAVAHRGPNGAGIWTSPSGRACFGHRRLAVIDVANGQQPMVSTDGTRGLVFNGEIYNYLEMRAELSAGGSTFRTQSDTEVLQNALERYGLGAIEKLRGMFAFAAWDDRTGELTIARDRVGKKPFYYRIHKDVLYFSSSLRALRRTVPGAWDIDPLAIDHYLTLGFIPAPQTIYRDVHKLPAGHVGAVKCDSSGLASLALTRYWNLDREDPPFDGSYTDALERLEGLLSEAVRLRLRSDVPLGIFLSGGVDSTLVAALAARHSPALETFSISFEEAAFDESTRAKEVSTLLGLRHHVFRVDSAISSVLPDLAAHFGEPIADSSALPMWLLSQETSKHVTVALGGDGGDEGFGGYLWYRTAARLARYSSVVPSALAGAAAGALRQFGMEARPSVGKVQRGLSALSLGDAADRFALLRSLFSILEKERLYSEEFQDVLQRRYGAAGMLADAYRKADGTALRRMRIVDQHFYLADDLMPKVDVTSMAFGLEARAPLLDQDVLRFALSLPDAYLVGERGGKQILRDLVDRLVPNLAPETTKRGFTAPMTHWIRGDLRDRVVELSSSRIVRSLGLLRARGISDMVSEHLAGRRDHADRIYALLVLDEWLRLEAAQIDDPQIGDVAIAG